MRTLSELAVGPVIAALDEQWHAIDTALSELSGDDWFRPTALPGWTVHDVVAHLIGTESKLAGIAPPEVHIDVHTLGHVHNEIGVFNEKWVEGLRGRSGAEMLERFRDITGRRREALSAMTEDDFAAPAQTPIGSQPYGRFMRLRLFDCWMHEHDIRDATGTSGDEGGARGELAFEEIHGAMGYAVGKLGQAPEGSRIAIELTGPLAHTIRVAVADGRATVVPELTDPPTATLTLDSRLFTRLCGGRTPARDHLDEITLGGDTAVARRIADHLAFTI